MYGAQSYVKLSMKNTLGSKCEKLPERESQALYAELQNLQCHRHVMFRHVDLVDLCQLQQYTHQEISSKGQFENLLKVKSIREKSIKLQT